MVLACVDGSTLIRIVQIFRSVLKFEMRLDVELYNAANRFLEFQLKRYQLHSRITNGFADLLGSEAIHNGINQQDSNEENGIPRDYFGKFYIQNLGHSEKKKSGIVYTPEWLARKMVRDGFHFFKEAEQAGITCLDPCCGTGVFLLETLWHSYSLLPPKKQTLDALLSLLHRIIGMDRDPIACLCTTLNLFLLSIRVNPTLITKIVQEPRLIQVHVQDFLMGGQIPVEKGDDSNLLIIGNPPYIFLRNLPPSEKARLKGHFASSTRQFDAYGLFFERSLDELPPKGIVSLVIPDSVLTLQNRLTTRELLLQNNHILKIWRVGDIFPGISVASVVITAQKIPPKSDSTQLFTEIGDTAEGDNHPVKKMPQDAFVQAGYSFAPAFTASAHSVLPHLRKFAASIIEFNETRNGSEQIVIARGIEIGKNGKVLECPTCHIFYPQPAKPQQCPRCKGDLETLDSLFFREGHIPTLFNRTETKPIVLGVQRWHCGGTERVVWGLRGIKYKDSAVYSERRVLIRQLLQKGCLCAALPPGGAATTQSVYNLNLSCSLDPLEILAVLNSDIIATAAFELFSSGKKLFPRILLHVMKDLPIIPKKSPPDAIKNSLKSLALQFLANPALDADEQARNQLNNLVLNYLGCASEDYQQILLAVREFTDITDRHGRA